MFEPGQAPAIGKTTVHDPEQGPSEGRRQKRQDPNFNWGHYSVAELINFRNDIDKALPPQRLADLDLENRMLLQFHLISEMQADVMSMEDVPANQLAQVANSVASSLKSLADHQNSLYTSERFKDVENLLIRTLDKLPEELALKFIEDYELILKKHTEK